MQSKPITLDTPSKKGKEKVKTSPTKLHVAVNPPKKSPPEAPGKEDGMDKLLVYPIIGSVIAGIITAVVLSRRNVWIFGQIRRWMLSSAGLLHGNFLASVQRSGEFFIPNVFQVFNKHDLGLAVDASGEGEIDSFIEQVLLSSERPFYMLLAPTGVGKTTFLSQVFLRYQKRSRFKRMDRLEFGKVHHSETLEALDLLIKSGAASKTILLLDGLDEFKIRGKQDPTLYWEMFYDLWEEKLVHSRLSRFKKVVVSVREQFFNSRDLENMTVDEVDFGKIRLLPFSEAAQRRSYLNKRFAGESSQQVMKRDEIIFLVEQLHGKGLHFVEKPLILNFMDDVWEAYREQYKNARNYEFFSNEFIYRTIINKWFDREAKSTDGATYSQKIALEGYCKKLAWLIYSGAKNGMDGEELMEMERTLNTIADLKGVQGRSLLIRVDSGRNTNGTNLSDQFQFIHESFLEFFIFLHLLEHPELEQNFPFDRYNFTLQLLVGSRWKKTKDTIKIGDPMPVDDYGTVRMPAESLAAIVEPFLKLVYDPIYGMALMRSGKMQELLTKEDPGWKLSLRNDYKLEIDNECFWDFERNAPFEKVSLAISLLKENIRSVKLNRIVVKDDMLACFEGCHRINDIQITYAELIGGGLNYFRSCVKNLVWLDLTFNFLRDHWLEVFDGADQLEHLILGHNCLDGSCLRYFATSNNKIIHLDFSYNELSDDHLKLLGKCPNIKSVDLRLNALNGAGLEIFRGTIDLESLDLSANRLTDDYLEYFSQNSRLNELRLEENKLNGTGLIHFSQLGQLKFLSLSRNPIDAIYLASFAGNDQLTQLDLGDIPLNGALVHFADCQLLEDIRLYNTGIDDAQLSVVNFGSGLLRVDLSGNRLTGWAFGALGGKLAKLERLDIGSNPINASLVDVFGNCTKLKELNLSNTQITASQLTYFSHSSKSLRYLQLDNLGFKDQDLSSFGELDGLVGLELNFNRLTGSFFKQVKKSSETLEVLKLSGNQITDQHLHALKSFTALETVDFSDNGLIGTGLVNLTSSGASLENLDISDNGIKDGYLRFLQLSKFLVSVDLRRNQLTGKCVNYLLNSAQTLTSLYLEGNPIVPQELLGIGPLELLDETDVYQWVQRVAEE